MSVRYVALKGELRLTLAEARDLLAALNTTALKGKAPTGREKLAKATQVAMIREQQPAKPTPAAFRRQWRRPAGPPSPVVVSPPHP